jgi:hypothetical protein
MKKVRWMCLLACVACVLGGASSAQAYLWDGTTAPAGATEGGNQSGAITWDFESGGFAYLDTGVGKSDYWTISVGSEMSRATGWTAQTRMAAWEPRDLSESWNTFMRFSDDAGTCYLTMWRTGIAVYDGEGNQILATTASTGWHVIDVAMAANGSAFTINVDGSLLGTVTGTLGSTNQQVQFGDGTNGGYYTPAAAWDYINVTAVPEPTTIGLILAGSVLLRRPRK